MKAPLVLLLLAVGANAARLSSSTAECVNGELRGIPGDCRKYYECINGTFEKKSCGFFKRYFNSKELKCTWFKRHCLPPEPITTPLPTDSTTSPPPTTTSPPPTTTSPPPTTTTPPPTTTSPPPTSPESTPIIPVTKSSPPVPKPSPEIQSSPQYTPSGTIGDTFESTPPMSTDYSTSSSEIPSTFPPKCNNGDRIGVPKDCHKYEECVAGVYVPKSCGMIKRYFDTKSKTCVMYGAKCEPDEPSQDKIIRTLLEAQVCKEGQRQGFPTDCSKYVHCINGTRIVKSCGYFRKFDVKTRKCVLYGAQCETGECLSGDITPVHGDCKKFRLCQNKKFVVKSCGYFRKFDAVSKECRYGATCAPASCKEGSLQPVEGNCKQYSVCENGTEQIKTCTWFRKFDSTSKSCVFFGAKCYENPSHLTTPKPAKT